MEEKPVQEVNPQAKVSLWLGILGFITTPLFSFKLESMFPGYFYGGEYSPWKEFTVRSYYLMPINLALGAAAVIVGANSIKKNRGKRTTAVAGIILGSLAILMGVGVLLLFLINIFVGDLWLGP